MEYRTLGQTGLRVSRLGFGGATLGGVYGPFEEAESIRAVHAALDLGINFIDVAPYYGRTLSETVLGKALKGVARDRYIVATKIGRYDVAEFDFSAESVRASVDGSLQRLGVDVIDLMQCHDIEFGDLNQVVDETIPTLRELREAGKVRHIGITGYPLKIFPFVMDRIEVDTILSYCHHTLNNDRLKGLIPYLKEKGVGIINASPLSMGLLTHAGPPDWHPAQPELKAACARAAEYCAARGADLSEIALRYAASHPDVASTLVGMKDVETLHRNLRAIQGETDPEVLAGIREILAPVKDLVWPSGRPENN